jgi:hypothetical protein
MPLMKQIVPISFGKGVDTKTDPKQIIAGKLSVLENGVFQVTNEIKKRNGFSQIGDSLSAGNALASFKDELLAMDGSIVKSYSAKQAAFNQKGTKLAVDLSVQSIVKNTYQQTLADSTVNQNLAVYAWEDSSGGVQCSVIDETTGQTLIQNQLVSADASRPKVMSVGNYIVIFYYNSSSLDLRYRAINVSTPTTLASSIQLTTTMSTVNPNFDACILNSKIYVVYNDQTSAINGFTIDSSLTKSVESLISGFNASLALTCFADSTLNQLWVAWSDFVAGGIVYIVKDTSFGAILAKTAIDATSISHNVTGSASNGAGRIFYEVVSTFSTTDYTNYFVRTVSATNAGVMTGLGDLVRSCGLGSKAFRYSGSVYVGVTHESSQQSTLFVVNTSGSVIAKVAPQLGGGVIKKPVLPEVNALSSSKFKFAYLFKDLVSAENGNIYTQTGVNAAILNFAQSLLNVSLGNNLHTSGGILSMYDGQSVVEHGFNIYPEGVGDNNSLSPTGYTSTLVGGGLSAGQYQFIQTYEWTDAQGQIHRSAPSTPYTVTVPTSITKTCTTTNASADVTVPELTGLSVGMSVSGTGVPANTHISQFNTTTSIKMDAVATATGTTTLTFTFAKQVDVSITNGSNKITISPTSTYPINQAIGFFNKDGTISFPAKVIKFIKVGMKINDAYQPGTGSKTITAISGNRLTLSATILSTNRFSLFTFTNVVTATLTNGSNSATAVSASDMARIQVGNRIDLTGGVQTTISAITGPSSFTTVANSTVSGSTACSVTVTGAFVFDVGQTLNINSSYFATNPKITDITEESGLATLTLNEYATNTGAGIAAIANQNGCANFTLPTLRVTDKTTGPVSLVVYSTEANGAVFYRTSSLEFPVLNDKTLDYVGFISTNTDDNLIGNNQLYTTGGELENTAAPATNITTTYKNRFIYIPSENPLSWGFSKQVVPGYPVEFSDSFLKNIDQRGGDITAVAPLDDKIIFFKKANIFFTSGDGPTPSGINDDFAEAQLVTSDGGCTEKKSVVNIPDGVMYKSAKGIYLLNRSLQNEYIGSDVESYNADTITSSVLISSLNQVRFTLSSGVTLMYDYFFKQWSVFTNVNGADSVIYNSLHTYIEPTGKVNQETVGTFNDNGSFIKLKITLGWLSFAGLQAYQRAYKFLLLGDYKSAHSLVVKAAYDFVDTFTQTVTIPVLSAPTTAYQYRVFLAKQSCEAIKLSIEDSQTSPIGEGFSLSALSLEVGMKTGLNKIEAARSYG